MFVVGDEIVHPMHGAGVIKSITSKRINGVEQTYYVLSVPSSNVVIMIPIRQCESIGIRPVMDGAAADIIIELFREAQIEDSANWNKRYRENMLRLKSGDLSEVSRVVKSLMLREKTRSLSTGERKMLVTAKQIMLSELVLAKNTTYNELESLLVSML